MTEQQTPDFSSDENSTTEGQRPTVETEKAKSFEDLITDVKRDLDTLTPFAIEALNPFTSIEELEEFSKKHGQGDGRTVYFIEVGEGEEIQGAYIQSFIKRFFPRIKFVTVSAGEASAKKNVIKTQMMDFYELFRQQDPKITGFEPPKKREIVFSMTPTKILHSSSPKPETVAELRGAFFQLLEEVCRESGVSLQNLDVPLLVGDLIVLRPNKDGDHLPFVPTVDISQLRKIGTSFRIINPIEGHIVCGFYNAEIDTYTEEARLPIAQDKILRALYTIGDFSVIRKNKNKMEGVVAGKRVITTSEYSDITHNPNLELDRLLRARGYIVTVDEVSGIDLHELGKAPQLTEQDIRNVYAEYMKSQNRLDFEPSLKESMQQLIDRIVAPPENLMTFIRNIFS